MLIKSIKRIKVRTGFVIFNILGAWRGVDAPYAGCVILTYFYLLVIKSIISLF